jgi:hypothetical protein
LLKDRVTTSGLLWVNRISGVIILGFGIVTLFGIVSLIR